MKKLDLNDPGNQELIKKIMYGTGLKVDNVTMQGVITELYKNKEGNNFFINAYTYMPPLTEATVKQQIFISAYFDYYFDNIRKITDQRVQLAFTIANTKFTPIVGSNILGILDTPNGYMMTYGIGSSINNNSPIEFKDCNGLELAHLIFEWNPEDFKEELVEASHGTDAKLDEKVNPIYTWTKRYFELLVDKKGHPKGFIYDSTTGEYLPTQQTDLSSFEVEFINRSANQAKEEEARRANEAVKLYGLVSKEGE